MSLLLQYRFFFFYFSSHPKARRLKVYLSKLQLGQIIIKHVCVYACKLPAHACVRVCVRVRVRAGCRMYRSLHMFKQPMFPLCISLMLLAGLLAGQWVA